jgi:SET domain-containing protein
MVFISSKIEVKGSPIHGMGVFAKENIKSGEIIENCHFTILEKPFFDIDKKLQEYVFAYPKINPTKSVVVWGYGSIYNHSKNNNADWISDEEKNVFTFFTIKDINEGEEIFTNYGEGYESVVKTIR